jgi:hypothetical protein
MKYFETKFLEEANEFIAELDPEDHQKNTLQHRPC